MPPSGIFDNTLSIERPYTAGSVVRTSRSNLAGIRVRVIGVSNDTVTRLSARTAVGPSGSVDAPWGTTGANGAFGRVTGSACGVTIVAAATLCDAGAGELGTVWVG